jgi:hypothetical protein
MVHRFTRPYFREVPLAMTPRLVVLAALLLGGNARAADPLQSGPPVGAENDRSGFRPQFVAGPSAGQRLCPV